MSGMAPVGSRKARMPSPFFRRRSLLERLPSLRLGQQPLKGIANAQYSVQGSVTWGTASDWDSASSESGVVHESVTNTDHADDAVIKQGYSAASPFQSPERYYAMHEDSGSTIYDFGTAAENGTIYAATLGATGLLGTTAYDFDATDDAVGAPNFSVERNHTIIQYIQTNDDQTVQQPFRASTGDVSDFGASISVDGGNFNYFVKDSNGNNLSISAAVPDTVNLHQVVGRWDGSTQALFVNGTKQTTASRSISVSQDNSGETMIGATDSSGSNPHDGRIAGTWLYGGTALSDSQITDHWNVLNTAGELVTDWKSLNLAATTLTTTSTLTTNSSIDVVVEQDVGSDDTVDNSQTVSLSGGTDETNSLSGFSSNSGRYRVRIQPDHTDINETAEFSKATLE